MYPSNLLPLSSLKESDTAEVIAVKTDNPMRIRLLGMGIGKGTRLEVLRNRGGDMVLGNGNNRISLGRNISEKIVVDANSIRRQTAQEKNQQMQQSLVTREL